MLAIKNLRTRIGDKEIIRGIDLDIGTGEVHVIMGPNGSGKSTLSQVLTGREGYDTEGEITYEGKDLLEMSPEDRAIAGIFLAFQYPVEIPGVGNLYFLRTALNAVLKQRGEDEINAVDFLALAKEKMKLVEMDQGFMSRSVNVDFSGGEKKRNEILQMLIFEPKLAILDEIDSGLDIDSLKIVANAVNALRDKKRSILIITHYQRLLEYITPDYVHVMVNGKIAKTGDKNLASDLEKSGYAIYGEKPSRAVGVGR